MCYSFLSLSISRTFPPVLYSILNITCEGCVLFLLHGPSLSSIFKELSRTAPFCLIISMNDSILTHLEHKSLHVLMVSFLG